MPIVQHSSLSSSPCRFEAGYSSVVWKGLLPVCGVEGISDVIKDQRFITTSLHQKEDLKGRWIESAETNHYKTVWWCLTSIVLDVWWLTSLSLSLTHRYIDLDKIISVQEVSPAQQDKNHATFLVQCDGRTYQLQAMDEATMRKYDCISLHCCSL